MIRIGPVGWTHPRLADLWPAERAPDFSPLRFLAARFGLVEVDATEHALPPRARVGAWLQALDGAPRTRLSVRLPGPLMDLRGDAAERAALAERFRDTLRPLVGRPQLAAFVGALDASVLHGPAELRSLTSIARVLRGTPLVLEALHPSWFEGRARAALRGAGWTLAHVEPEDTWNAPPTEFTPSPGAPAMLRIVRAGPVADTLVAALADRAQRLARSARDVYVVSAHSGGADDALDRLTTALRLKHVLAPSAMMPPWPELARSVRPPQP